MSGGSRQLLAFRFGSDSNFEGQLVGALERIEVGGTLRVLDGLFVAREPESGELSAIALSDSPPSRRTSLILDFRLDERERTGATRRALAGAAGEAVQALAALLGPGTAVAAVLVEHKPAAAVTDPADALADPVARVGGTMVTSEFVDATRLSELTPRLLTAVG
ncbi:MAG TPA: hypothetical protein VH418_16945 [Solirubrobacteraceae bacterium]|jgi:hypothetical protein